MVVNSLRPADLALYHKLKVMKTLFDKINIESIQFESGINEVHVNCNITQGKQTFKSELLLNYTDLNLLIGRIQQLSAQTDVMSCFERIDMQDGHDLYSLQFNRTGLADLWIDGLEFNHPLRQIRA